MGWTRRTGALVSLALLASVAGHFAVQRHFEWRQRNLNAVLPRVPLHAELSLSARSWLGKPPQEFVPPPLLPPGSLLAAENIESSAIPRFLGEFDRPTRLSQVISALQLRDDDEPARGPSKRGASGGESSNPTLPPPPRTVLAPQDATALTEAPGSTKDSGLPSLPEAQEEGDERAPLGVDANAVRRVIEEELAGSSREERDIWYDELKSIPAGVVRNLLQVRKQLRSLPRWLSRRSRLLHRSRSRSAW